MAHPVMQRSTLIAAFSFFSLLVYSQNVGINTSNPTASLDVNGSLRIRTGTPGAGKVLVSDASGNVTWKNRKVAFRAKGIQAGGMANIPYNSYYRLYFAEESYDHGNNFNLDPSSPNRSIFTVSVAGIYHFNAHLFFESKFYDGASSKYTILILRLQIRRNGVVSTYTHRIKNCYGEVYSEGMNIEDDIRLLPNDEIWLEVLQGNSKGIVMPIASDVERAGFACHLVYEE